jgi:adenine-specific DNA-methyltransferase
MSFNYIGSKKSLTDFIEIPIKKILETCNKKNLKMLDGFAGTGTIGKYFHTKYNFIITANDMEYYSYVINHSLLCVPFTDKIKELIGMLNIELCDNSIDKTIDNYNMIATNYSTKGETKRKFWTEENAINADYIRYRIDTMLKQNNITNDEHIFLVASLLQAMDETANTACVYGAFLKEFKKSALKKIVLKPVHTNSFISKNTAYNCDINSMNIYNNKYDICYLDPPYNERQYASNYHPLNFIAKYDSKIKVYGKTGLIENYNKSKYCNKGKAYEMLKELFENLNTKHILLSYNNEGIIEFNDIKELLQNMGKVILYKKVYKKFKSNNVETNANVYEYLFHCELNNTKSYSEVLID